MKYNFAHVATLTGFAVAHSVKPIFQYVVDNFTGSIYHE